MGRNGDQSYVSECRMNIELKEKELIVNPMSLDSTINKECYLYDELPGKYFLKNGEVIKKEDSTE